MFGKGKQTIKMKYYEGLCGFSPHSTVSVTDDVDQILFQPDQSYLTVKLPIRKIVDLQLLAERDFLILCHNTCPMDIPESTRRMYLVLFYLSEAGEKRFVALYEDGTKKSASFGARLLERVVPPEYTL